MSLWLGIYTILMFLGGGSFVLAAVTAGLKLWPSFTLAVLLTIYLLVMANRLYSAASKAHYGGPL